MKKIFILLCALAALAAASCTEKEDFAPAGEKVAREFTTVLTKTTLHTDGATVYWEEGDAISIFDGVGNNQFDIQGYDNASPSASATFSGTVDAGATSFYAVYPYAAGNGLAASTLTAEVPATQSLKTGSFQSGAAVAVAYTTSNSLAFHQATAILGITLDSYMTDVESIEFYGNNNEYVAGAVSVAMNTSTGDVASVTPGTGSKKITLTGTFVAGETYYLSFIPQTFTSGVTVIVNFDGDKTGIVTSSKSLTTEAGMSYPIANFTRITLPKATFYAKNSFNYDSGAAQDLAPVSHANIASITVDNAPAGWDLAWDTDHFEVTPPTQAEIQATPQTVVPEGVFEVTLRSAAGHSRQVEIPVRLYGINCLMDLKALQDNAVMDTPANAAPYLVNAAGVDELTLNTDLTLQTTDLKSSAIALHHNTYAINGNGRTVTYDNVTVSAWPSGFVQNLQNDVHDINFAGAITNTSDAANVGVLAARGYDLLKDELVIKNVTSSVDITWNGTSSNTYVGGLVGWMVESSDAKAPRNKSITFNNCVVTGDITLNGELISAGGIIGQGEKFGQTATAWTTLDGCTYSGVLTYSPDATQNKPTRIGGLVGNSERQLKLKDCLVDGTIEVNLGNKIFGKSNHDRAIGGVVGRTTAQSGTYASPYCMAYRLSNVRTSANINVHGTNMSEVKDCFQIRAYGLCARTDLDGNATSYNVEVIGGAKISFDNYAGPEINGVTSPVTFSYGETKNLDVTTGDLTDWTVTAALDGWTINTDHITDGSPYISVTAPTQDAIKAGSAVGAGEIAFTGTHATLGSAPTGGSGQSVRLYGINNIAEFQTFRSIYGAQENTPVTTGIDDYLVSGKLTLNSDLSFAGSDIQLNAYVLKNLVLPLEGNNRSVTCTISGSAGIVALFQNIKANVSNLYLDGTYTSTGSSGTLYMGALAGQAAAALTVSNVHVKSSAKLQYNKTVELGLDNNRVGGLVGQIAGNIVVNFSNCSVAAQITAQNALASLGGFLGNSGTGAASEAVFTDCTFSGAIVYNLNASCTTTDRNRVGGILGDLSRIARFTRCYNTGTMTLNAGGYNYTVSGTGTNSGFGGIVGRNTATNGSNTMETYMKTVENSATITVNDLAATQNTSVSGGVFGQIIGSTRQAPNQYDNVSENGTLTINVAP